MKKLYSLFLTFVFFALVCPLHAQEVIWAVANNYQGASRFVTTLSNNGSEIAYPIPNTSTDNVWGDHRPQLYLASDRNAYGLTPNYTGSIFYKITNDGIHLVRQFDYGSFGPMAEGDAGNFYIFSSGADGNHVVIERTNSQGLNYKQYAFYKASFRPHRLLNSGGVLYGVSNAGGANAGSGYLFRFTPTDDMKNFEVLFNFSSTNGRKPVGALVEGSDGYLYGVTSTGGANEGGVVYKIRKDGTGFTKIYDFVQSTGRYPSTGLVTDGAGWLYGATASGGPANGGVVFKIRMDGTGYKIVNGFAPSSGSMGDIAYHDQHLYLFHHYTGQSPAILKLHVDGGWSYFHIYADTGMFEGHSILVDTNPKPAKVVTTSPADGGTIAPIDVRLEFSRVTNASRYTFELSFSPDFAEIQMRRESSEPVYTITSLQSAKKYYIRVKTNVWPTFGPVTSFTTAELNAYNTRISNPKDGAINVSAPSTKVTAGLITGAKRYTIELSTTPDFAIKIVRTSKVDNQRTLIFDSLRYSTRYYGRFKTDISYYGRVTSFTTAAETFSAMVSPSDGLTDVAPLVVDLVVEPSRADAKRHTIQLSTSSQFTIVQFESKSVEDYQTNHVIKNLKYATRYFVRIKSDLNENWSRTFSFRTRERIAAVRLWGVTTAGGTYDVGTVFSYDLTSNTFAKHHDYDPITYEEEYTYYDYGEALQGSLIHGNDDKLYFHSSTKGSSAYGGSLFQVDRFNDVNHIDEIALHYGNMTLASNNTIYTSVNSHLGPGVIDSYEIHSATWERIKVFTRSNGVDPGSELVELHDGYLYGRATEGGVGNGGTLYRVRYDGSGFQVTHLFTDAVNGLQPTGDLVLGDDGFFYGTTRAGGANGRGTVFKVRPDGSEFSKIFDFNGSNGAAPLGGVNLRGDIMYGTTSSGGAYGGGTVFKLYTNGNGFVTLFNFAGSNGRVPEGRLAWHSYNLYGMTTAGGTHDKGTIFRISTTGVGFEVLHSFDGETGAYPDGHLIVREDFGSATSAMMIQEEQKQMVDVAPNPSSTDFAISMANPADEKVLITITDMNGLVVHESELTMTESKRIGESLPKGIYILKARVSERTTMHRLVKK